MANEVNGETIQEDVKPVNPKLAMREAIVQSVNAQRDEENGVEEEVVEETTEVEEVEDVAEELEESNTQDQEVEESQQEEEELVTIKVDGKEEQVPLSKIKDAGVRTFQKETAADKRLQEISEREKQLQAYTQQIIANQQQPQVQKDASPQIDPRIKQWTEAIQFGTEEEAAGAIQQMMASGQSQAAPDINSVLSAVDAKLHTAEMDRFINSPPEQGGYADIVEDPMTKQMAASQIDARINARYQQTGQLTPATREDYDVVLGGIREWKKQFQPKEQLVNTQERTNRKKQADNVNTSSARHQKQEEKEPTRQDVINGMRGKRAR
jgi:hypothetical protein